VTALALLVAVVMVVATLVVVGRGMHRGRSTAWAPLYEETNAQLRRLAAMLGGEYVEPPPDSRPYVFGLVRGRLGDCDYVVTTVGTMRLLTRSGCMTRIHTQCGDGAERKVEHRGPGFEAPALDPQLLRAAVYAACGP
jgi:hypothetical protein